MGEYLRTVNLMGHTLTDLINSLPGNSSVNTVQHATIDVIGAEQWWKNGVMQPVSKQRFCKHTSS
jgi:hypothetical protein